MFKIIWLCSVIVIVYGHQFSNKLLTEDADMETALMPQELNPEFVPEKVNLKQKDAPWQALLPIMRTRRDAVVALTEEPSVVQQVKYYSRIVACSTLALAALVEIIVYVIEIYA